MYITLNNMRTQITFETHDEKIFNRIKEEARRQGLSTASLCRHIIFEKINQVNNGANTTSSN